MLVILKVLKERDKHIHILYIYIYTIHTYIHICSVTEKAVYSVRH